MHRPSLASTLIFLTMFVAACDSSSSPSSPGSDDIIFGGDSAGGTVTTFSFPIQIQIDPTRFDSESLELRLNGVPLALDGGPSQFSTVVEPGPPLRDDNTLEVSIAPAGGGSRVVSRRDFRYLPPKARARRIADESDLIRGPLGHSRIGDYLLANGKARFIVQDISQRDLYSVGTFGGNLIDAELVDAPGRDNFLEIQPAINIETVINAQSVEIVNDGQDGTAAVLRTCGPDDIIDFINPSALIAAAGFNFPAAADDVDANAEGCTDYVLEPEQARVQMTTTVFNNDPTDRGFYVGDYINGSGELDQFTTLGAGIGEALTNRLSTMSFVGIGEAQGVDYSLVLLPETASDRSSFFTTSGVSYILRNQLVVNVVLSGEPAGFVVPAQGSRSFTRYFGVGSGSIASAIDIENEVTGAATGIVRGCITSGGQPLEAARVSFGRGGESIRQIATQFTTGSDGCYQGTLKPGNYLLAAGRRGYPYEGGGNSPVLHPVTVIAGETVVQNIELPKTGRLRVTVVDQDEGPMPARVSVIGFDPSPEIVLNLTTPIGTTATGLFHDVSKDPIPFGLAWVEYADAQGVADFAMEPGDYVVAVSRGTEYSLFSQRVSVVAEETTTVASRIAHVVDTDGFISSDYHVHGIHSADSRVSHRNRVYQFAGEGVDNVIMTDHEANTDLTPRIEQLGFTRFLHSTIGEEITTSDYGHFNAYPLNRDASRISGGSLDWAVGAAPGADFPSLGSYSMTPGQIADLARNSPPVSRPTTTIQINHIDSHFAPLKIDTSLVPPQSLLSPEEKLRFRIDPASGNLFAAYPALEIWNGASRFKQHEFLDLRLGVWFNHLNQGLITTGIGDTDTHEFMNLSVAGARTWTASPTDDPREIDADDVAIAVNAGRAIGGQGPFIETRLLAADGSDAVAELRLDGQTEVRSTNGAVDLQIRVQAPTWAEFDTIEIYANAPTLVTQTNGGVPVSFTASPARTLHAGTDFTIERIQTTAAVPGAERLEANVTVSFRNLTEDTWFVAIARGTDGISRPMFPVMVSDLDPTRNATLEDLVDGNLGEGGVTALAFTNPLFADVDGLAGFQSPLPR